MGLLMNSTRGSATLVLIVLALAAVPVGALNDKNRELLTAQVKPRCPECYNVDTIIVDGQCEKDNECARTYNCEPIDCDAISGPEMATCYESAEQLYENYDEKDFMNKYACARNYPEQDKYSCEDMRAREKCYLEFLPNCQKLITVMINHACNVGDIVVKEPVEAPAVNPGETDNAETAAPETAAPETAAPETAAPDTAAPDTAAPETSAPDTAAPDTAAPDTAAPDTAAPETSAPETPAPETSAPETPAPETPAPETSAPETPAPETPAPETPAPETPAPETPAPEAATTPQVIAGTTGADTGNVA